MGKRKVIIGFAAVILAGLVFGSGMLVGAATNGAGSQNDPVVSLSYLEYRLDKLEGGSGSGRYTKVELNKGDSYVPGEGSVIVVLSGNATVFGESGLVNITEGTMFPKDCSLVLYNQFLVPDSNSGIKAAGKVVLYVLD